MNKVADFCQMIQMINPSLSGCVFRAISGGGIVSIALLYRGKVTIKKDVKEKDVPSSQNARWKLAVDIAGSMREEYQLELLAQPEFTLSGGEHA